MNDDTIGKRFSHVYLTDGEALPDSPRARVRIATLLDTLDLGPGGNFSTNLVRAIKHELGVKVRGGSALLLY